MGWTRQQIERVRVRVAQGHLRVCNIPEPETGLEIKFSLRHTAAMALTGVDTGAIDSYSDAIAARPDLVALRRKVEVEPQAVSRTMVTGADIVVDTSRRDDADQCVRCGHPGHRYSISQEARLIEKFDALAGQVLGHGKVLQRLKSMVLGERCLLRWKS